MPEIGKNLSHYNLVGKIGKGGMGEVFRAKDQKLGRDVAIKVLPEEFARDTERVARFLPEAKLLASLNHPNIASIYGLEESEGTNFLVLELIEGETLSDRIKAGPIPVEEALKLALQIAEALEAAHEKGVIHRDLKPSNIKVTPDGKRIVFYSERNNEPGLYWKAADGTGEVEKLCSAPEPQLIPYSWSGDGKGLITNQFIEGGMSNQDVMMLSMEGDRATKPILQEKFLEIQPKISPDGRWMAYVSNESGKTEVYVRPFPDVNKGRWQVSTNGGDSPIWSPDGRELFYLNGDSVMAVSVDAESALSLGTPKLLFHGSFVGAYPVDGTPWDISPDGKRFLMIKSPQAVPPAEGAPRRINIVLNWLEDLKQKVPAR